MSKEDPPGIPLRARTLRVSGGPVLRLPVFDLEPCPPPPAPGTQVPHVHICVFLKEWTSPPCFSGLVRNRGSPDLLDRAGPRSSCVLVVLAFKTPPRSAVCGCSPYQEWGSHPVCGVLHTEQTKAALQPVPAGEKGLFSVQG